MKTQLIVGAVSLILSFCACAGEPNGGLEQIIDQMEQNGVTHDMQMGAPDDDEPTDEVSEQPAPGVSDSNNNNNSAMPAGVSAPKAAAATVEQPIATHTVSARTKTTSEWQQLKGSASKITVKTQATSARHNPLADQAAASGGLEQIIDRMQLNASVPMRVGQAPDSPVAGAARDASLGERFAN